MAETVSKIASMLRGIKTFLSKDTSAAVRRDLYAVNLHRMVFIGPIFFVIEASLLPFQHQLLDTGKVIGIYLISNVLLYPFVLYADKYQKKLSEWHIRLTYLVYLFSVLGLGVGLSLKGLEQVDLSHVYLMTAVALSMFFSFSSMEHAVLLTLGFIPFYYFLPSVLQHQQYFHVVASNALIFNFLAWLFGRLNYRSTAKALLTNKQLERQNVLLADLVKKDPMTQLLNHEASQDLIRAEILKSQRIGIPFSIILLDVDDFKKINDEYGHLAGDEVLIKLGNFLQASVRKSDYVGRYGGDEFIIILPMTGFADAKIFAERLWDGVRSLQYELSEMHVTISGGVEEYDLPFDTSIEAAASEIISAADSKLFKAKAAGKNTYVA